MNFPRGFPNTDRVLEPALCLFPAMVHFLLLGIVESTLHDPVWISSWSKNLDVVSQVFGPTFRLTNEPYS